MRLALALCLAAGMAAALPPETSLRPVYRAGTAATGTVPAQPDAPAATQVVTRSLRPALRPPQVVARAVVRQQERRRGAVCGAVEIQGEEIGPVPGKISGCGVSDAVRVRSVSGIALTRPAVVDCPTARALNTWVVQTARPVLRGIGGGLDRLKVAAHYACRTRNHKTGARISEHGKGRAIDISGFHMRDGSLITVEQGWTAGATTQAMRRIHRGACGPFGTVLGPDADSFHRDHFHFDTARYRSGTYCR